MLRREFSLKVICEKVKFSSCDICNNFHGYEWTNIYFFFKNIFNDVLPTTKEINIWFFNITTPNIVF